MIQLPLYEDGKFKPPQTSTLIVAGVLFVVGFIGLYVARQMIEPLDGLLTRRVCVAAAQEVARTVEEVEPSNRFAIINRSQGSCLFSAVDAERAQELADELEEGEVPDYSVAGALLAAEDPDAEVRLAVPDMEPDRVYRAGKWMGLILQFGAASVAVRLVAEPLLDRFSRRPVPQS